MNNLSRVILKHPASAITKSRLQKWCFWHMRGLIMGLDENGEDDKLMGDEDEFI